MTPGDPRHGTHAGYVAGCRCLPCSDGHYRYQKRSTLRRAREGGQIVPAHRVLARRQWWEQRGVAPSAVAAAAGIGEGVLFDLGNGQHSRVLRSTERAVLAVTWADFPDESMCNAHLTRHRIYSLMAAGHSLAWIAASAGLPITGRWRYQERVGVGLARAVLDLYYRAPASGPSAQTASKARGRGYRHPLAWDDPGVPAMPANWNPYAREDIA